MAVTVKEKWSRDTKKIGELTVGDVFNLNNTLFVVTSYDDDDEIIFKGMVLNSDRFGELVPFFRDTDGDEIVEVVKDIEINVRY